jgi:small nuclear ribonucleoprotein (snRNP)-like protein
LAPRAWFDLMTFFSIQNFFYVKDKKGKTPHKHEREREREREKEREKKMTSSSSSSSSSKEARGRKEEEGEATEALDPARSKEYVRKLIQERQSSSSGSLVRVEVTDGRTFEGTLGCVDKQLNVVLINATETKKRNEISQGDASSTSSERLGETRVINMALIAREHRVKMEVLVADDDAATEGEDGVKKENKSLLESALETMRII